MGWDESRHPRAGHGRFAATTHDEGAVELVAPGAWPAHGERTMPWQARTRGNRADRMLAEITVSLPPMIADLGYYPTSKVAAAIERATIAIAGLDAGPGRGLTGLGSFLLRSEAVSSSRIEHIRSTRNDFAKALVGVKASETATVTVAAVRALQTMVAAAGDSGRVELADMLTAHHQLMGNDWQEAGYAGRIRDVQNWILGSDHTPIGAVHIPPPADTVEGYLHDLVRFANRDDLPAIAQAAIVHAQFESIHPFTDGNGRIGRALISAVLRRRGLALTTVVPVASAMLADTTTYFALINDYRTGSVEPFVAYLADSSVTASQEAQQAALRLQAMPAGWREMATPRTGSVDSKIIGLLLEHPVLDAADAQRYTAASTTSVYDGLERLVAAGVLDPVTTGRRNQVWIAADVMDEIEQMNSRIGSRTASKP